jgi:hypothetical protein
VLIDSLLQAGDLLPEFVDLVFEVLLAPADAGVTGLYKVVVLAKVPTAKPPAAPTVAPSTNLVVPWPKSVCPSRSPSFDGASLAQRPYRKVILDRA